MNSLPHLHNHKLHRFIKRTLHELNPKGKAGASTLSLQEHDATQSIFERSIESGLSRTHLLNPETPLHCTTEDFTAPILDSTAEMIRNPNVDLSCVKLNCLSDEGEDSDDPLSSRHADEDEEDEPRHYYEDGGNHEYFGPYRLRSRSIISTSLMTCLEHGDDKKKCGSTSPLMRRMSKRSEPGDEDHTIEYYSFADMVNNEGDEQASRTRKGSCYTISVKDYIETQTA